MKKFVSKAEDVSHLSLDFFRMFLGVALMAKGGYFITHIQTLFGQIQGNFPYGDFVLAHYIVFAHLVGGLLISLGVLTRTACAFNIPILIGAILFVHSKEGLFTAGQGMELAVMTLMALCVIFWHGSGTLSVDTLIESSREAEEADEEAKEKRHQEEVKKAG
jgi:uncharacterized membrane protein YphA (DoxX/SURF4 family)